MAQKKPRMESNLKIATFNITLAWVAVKVYIELST